MDNTTDTQLPAVNGETTEAVAAPEATQPAATEAKAQEATPEQPKETLSQALSSEKSNRKPESVPIDVALQWKRDAKEAKRQLEEAQKLSAQAQTPKGLEEAADALAAKYQLDPAFTRELLSTQASISVPEAERRAREALEAELAPVREIREREQQADVRRRFDAMLDVSLANRPDVAGRANRDVLFRLATDPSYADKTMDDLIGEVYGAAPAAPRPAVDTVETARPTRTPEEIDFSKVAFDGELSKSVLSDPALKARYNSWVLENL